jgi:uncharacterized membrane protein YdbT with pleckstrin-like domain
MSSNSPFIENQLKKGESILYAVKPTWKAVQVYGGIFILLFAIWATFTPDENSLMSQLLYMILNYPLGMLLVFLFFGVAALSLYIHGSEFAVTSQRVIGKTGVISRSTFEIPLNQSEGMIVYQGVIGRILGYGSILKSGTGGAKTGIHFIPAPWDVRKRIITCVEESE